MGGQLCATLYKPRRHVCAMVHRLSHSVSNPLLMRRWTPFVTSAKSKPWTDESRRRCLKQAATLAGTAPLASALGAAVGAATAAAVSLSAHAQGAVDASNPEAAPSGAKGYQSSSPDEAAFVEALVNVMCPANELTPNGVDCGLATFIDRQLAGGYRAGAARVMKDVIDNTPDMTSAARRLFGKSVTRDRPRAVFPDQETYNDLTRTLLAETAFQQVQHRAGRLSGAPASFCGDPHDH